MLNLCSSGSTTRLGRREVTRTKYDKSFKSFVRDELSGVKFNPYFVYMKPALALFTLFIALTFIFTIMDNLKFVLSSNLSDFITNKIGEFNSGSFVDFEKVKSRCNTSLFIILIITTIIVVLAVISTILFSISCIVSSRKIHEYCINSIFKNSSSVIKIKKQVSQIITYLSCDIDFLDDDLPYDFYLSLVSFIQMLIDIVTLFYFIPFSIVFTTLAILLFHYTVFTYYLGSYKHIQLAYLECISHINTIFENAIHGSSICRGYKKESQQVDIIMESNEYFNRHYFLLYAIATWGSMLFNWIFSCNALLILVIPIFFNKYAKYRLKTGDYGLSLSLLVDVMKTYTTFSLRFARMAAFITSIQRFRYFIPPGEKVKFGKFFNAHEEFVAKPSGGDQNVLNESQLLKRRIFEFKCDDKKFKYFRKLLFNPKINIMNINNYLPPEHSGIELKNVCVYTEADHNSEGMILKNITASANRSEIIGMVGRTGSGKTTLLSVIQNIVENRTGQVLLDGKEINEVPKEVLAQVVGVLPQLPFVFKGWTIRRFLDPRKLFSDDEIIQALDLCGLLDFVNDLQGGKKLDTIISAEDISMSKKNVDVGKNHYPSESMKSDRSLTMECLKNYYINTDITLSNTQLRTLAFTRLVLYRQFYRIILVDEPPANNISDRPNIQDVDIGIPIYELLQKHFSHCTTFVAAHDDNALSMCTLVWVIHKGSIMMKYGIEDIKLNSYISTDRQEDGLGADLDYPFWESYLYDKTFFKDKNQDKKFRYYDLSNFLKFFFFDWVYRWSKCASTRFIESYKLHPLPVSDQILRWQPVFSKHVSDGLVRLELFKTPKSHTGNLGKTSAYRFVLLRAIFLTFWKRTLIGLMGIIITNIMSMSIAILVKKLLGILNDQTTSLAKTILLLFAIILFNLVDGLVVDNITFYLYRLIYIIQCCASITMFQHGLCHRRNFSNDVNGSNYLGVCNQVLHTCSPDSKCSQNPLFCQALRYQNKELNARIVTFQFSDCYYISMCLESLIYIVNFLTSFIHGIILMSLQFKIKLWILYFIGVPFVVVMVFVEALNSYFLSVAYVVKDFRISKSIEIVSSLPIIIKMAFDRIAMNIITECRNSELLFFLIRYFLTFLNTSLFVVFTNISFYILKKCFVKAVNEATVITQIDTAGFMSTFYILLQIIESMFLVPNSFRVISSSYVAYRRVGKYLKRCSPNFYISDNKYTGSVKASSNVVQVTDEVPNDAVVYYKDASFAWVCSSKDLLDYNYEPSLNNVNFQLKRGEIAIITGAQGSGKSNFIKSMLGEMTLVGGSMAVVPLHTSMPIFYASQDIWLHQGTIRSNITFGYRFDEQIYNNLTTPTL
nr:ABC transporter [Theileria orientalis]